MFANLVLYFILVTIVTRDLPGALKLIYSAISLTREHDIDQRCRPYARTASLS